LIFHCNWFWINTKLGTAFSRPEWVSKLKKKVLYVLASRARKHLHIISETGRNINRHNPSGLLPTSHLREYEFDYSEVSIK